MTVAIFPGSFDPFTLGHADLVRRALKLVDRLHIVVFVHPDKPGWLAPEARADAIRAWVAEQPESGQIAVDISRDLLARYCARQGIPIVVRGIRSAEDFSYEVAMAETNRRLWPGLETLYLATRPELAYVSASRVRELWRYGAPLDGMVPAAVARVLPAAVRG
jgi:pantetheine-phosphate adenylyltransferase